MNARDRIDWDAADGRRARGFARCLAVLLVFASAEVAAQSAPPALGYAVADRNLRLRAQPTTASRAVSSVPEGYRMLLGPCERSWCEVQYLGVRGYAPQRYLRPERLSPVRPRRNATPSDAPERAENEAASNPEAEAPTRPRPPAVERAQVRPPTALVAERLVPEDGQPIPTEDSSDEQPSDEQPTEMGAADRSDRPAEDEATREAEPVAANPPVPAEPRVCPDLVARAEEQFYAGALDAAVGLASNCLMAGAPTTDEARTVYRLLAKAHAQLDREGDARLALLQLLALDPAYEPERRYFDPAFTALVSDVKRQLGLPAPYQCDAELADAYQLYVEGDSEGALFLAQACLANADLVEPEAIEAHRLAALTHLKQGDIAAARTTVAALLERMPDYAADPVWDLPAYVALVNLVRTQRQAASPEQ